MTRIKAIKWLYKAASIAKILYDSPSRKNQVNRHVINRTFVGSIVMPAIWLPNNTEDTVNYLVEDCVFSALQTAIWHAARPRVNKRLEWRPKILYPEDLMAL